MSGETSMATKVVRTGADDGEALVYVDGVVVGRVWRAWFRCGGESWTFDGVRSSRTRTAAVRRLIRKSITNGPWTERGGTVLDADSLPVCEIYARPEDDDRRGRPTADANGRAICALPDLLAACEKAAAAMARFSGTDAWTEGDVATFDMLRAAIAKVSP